MRRGIFNGLERSTSYFFLCNCLTLKVKALPFPPSSPQASFTLPRFRLRIEIKMVAQLSISTTFPHISIHFGRFARWHTRLYNIVNIPFEMLFYLPLNSTCTVTFFPCCFLFPFCFVFLFKRTTNTRGANRLNLGELLLGERPSGETT